jgi:hypothetical protein
MIISLWIRVWFTMTRWMFKCQIFPVWPLFGRYLANCSNTFWKFGHLLSEGYFNIYPIIKMFGTGITDPLSSLHPSESGWTAQNIGCSGNEVVSMAAFSIRYLISALSADCAERFHRVLKRRFRSESWKTCDCSANLIPCRNLARDLPMLLNNPISIYDIFIILRSGRCVARTWCLFLLFAMYGPRQFDQDWPIWGY